MEEEVMKKINALIERARQKREAGIQDPPLSTIPKENSFADNMKSQEQADHFMMLLSLLENKSSIPKSR